MRFNVKCGKNAVGEVENEDTSGEKVKKSAYSAALSLGLENIPMFVFTHMFCKVNSLQFALSRAKLDLLSNSAF